MDELLFDVLCEKDVGERMKTHKAPSFDSMAATNEFKTSMLTFSTFTENNLNFDTEKLK